MSMTDDNQNAHPEQPNTNPACFHASPEGEAPQQQATPGGMPPEHRLLTKAQVAEYFDKDERTIENWMATGQLSYRKIGRTIRFKISDLLEDLDRFKVRQGR